MDAIRRKHSIPFSKVQTAVQFLKKHFNSRHPLADAEFETDGINLFIQRFEHFINVSDDGQLAMRSILEARLQRIDRDPKGLPIRLYPFIRSTDPQEPRFVVIDPYVAFGRPSIAGTRITTATIAERFRAGESVQALAEDYGRNADQLKKPSVASSTATPPDTLPFFLDANLGRHQIADQLRVAGETVIVHDEHFPQGTKDEVWLTEIGKKGWIVLTKDDQIRYHHTEIESIKQALRGAGDHSATRKYESRRSRKNIGGGIAADQTLREENSSPIHWPLISAWEGGGNQDLTRRPR